MAKAGADKRRLAGRRRNAGRTTTGPPSRLRDTRQHVAADCAFGLYRLAGWVGAPLVRVHLRRRARRGREDTERLAERLGTASCARPVGPLGWLHAASVGEAVSCLALIDRLRAERPGLNLLMTTGTVTSARVMAERLPRGVIHQYAPVDLPVAVGAFLDHWRPDLALIVESELWPNLLTAAARRGITLALINGRMSAASYRAWRRFGPLIRRLLGRFSLVLAQSPQDRDRLAALGAVAPACAGNLKFAAAPPPADPAELAALSAALAGRPCWLAASTHPGEEALAARVHTTLAAERPDLVTVIAPRHPERGPRIAKALADADLPSGRRSRGDAIGPETAIYLADTIGELGLWYRLAEVVFVGGSLAAKEGQNLIEPAKLGAAILTGPRTGNFAEIAQEMIAAGALVQVADGAALTTEVGRLLAEAPARAAMGRAAEAYAAARSGVLEDVLEALGPWLGRACAETERADRPLI
jgi:3-deoxy-D-manno-octulosonic-acid transferase